MKTYFKDVDIDEVKDMMSEVFFDNLNLIPEKRIEIASYLVYYHSENDRYTESYFVSFTGRLVNFPTKESAIAFAAARLGDIILNKDIRLIKYILQNLCKKDIYNGGYEQWSCRDNEIFTTAVAGSKDLLVDVMLDDLYGAVRSDADHIIARMNKIKSVIM